MEEPTTSGDLWTSPTEWSIEASGTIGGEYDPDRDRMYNGHELNVWGNPRRGRIGALRHREVTAM